MKDAAATTARRTVAFMRLYFRFARDLIFARKSWKKRAAITEAIGQALATQ